MAKANQGICIVIFIVGVILTWSSGFCLSPSLQLATDYRGKMNSYQELLSDQSQKLIQEDGTYYLEEETTYLLNDVVDISFEQYSGTKFDKGHVLFLKGKYYGYIGSYRYGEGYEIITEDAKLNVRLFQDPETKKWTEVTRKSYKNIHEAYNDMQKVGMQVALQISALERLRRLQAQLLAHPILRNLFYISWEDGKAKVHIYKGIGYLIPHDITQNIKIYSEIVVSELTDHNKSYEEYDNIMQAFEKIQKLALYVNESIQEVKAQVGNSFQFTNGVLSSFEVGSDKYLANEQLIGAVDSSVQDVRYYLLEQISHGNAIRYIKTTNTLIIDPTWMNPEQRDNKTMLTINLTTQMDQNKRYYTAQELEDMIFAIEGLVEAYTAMNLQQKQIEQALEDLGSEVRRATDDLFTLEEKNKRLANFPLPKIIRNTAVGKPVLLFTTRLIQVFRYGNRWGRFFLTVFEALRRAVIVQRGKKEEHSRSRIRYYWAIKNAWNEIIRMFKATLPIGTLVVVSVTAPQQEEQEAGVVYPGGGVQVFLAGLTTLQTGHFINAAGQTVYGRTLHDNVQTFLPTATIMIDRNELKPQLEAIEPVEKRQEKLAKEFKQIDPDRCMRAILYEMTEDEEYLADPVEEPIEYQNDLQFVGLDSVQAKRIQENIQVLAGKRMRIEMQIPNKATPVFQRASTRNPAMMTFSPIYPETIMKKIEGEV